jgi:hypothetical protein
LKIFLTELAVSFRVPYGKNVNKQHGILYFWDRPMEAHWAIYAATVVICVLVCLIKCSRWIGPLSSEMLCGREQLINS